MANKTVTVPEELWVDFINVIFSAVQHVVPTEENENIMLHLKQIVGDSFQNKEILILDGKIVGRDALKD